MRSFFMGLQWKLQCWRAFFSPQRGWADRYDQYLKGKRVWPVEESPSLPPTIPFPVEWIPVQWIEVDEGIDWVQPTSTFRLCSSVSAESGTPLPIGKGVRCVRCGIHLHEDEAHMYSPYDPPKCSRCQWIIRLLF